MDIEKAERLLDKVHLALSRENPDWMEEALKKDRMPKGAAEAVKSMLRANKLEDMDETARQELAGHWTELGSADFAKLIAPGEKKINSNKDKINAE